jgi:vancomycin resistance protein YoaR
MNISDIMRQYMKMLEDAMTDAPASEVTDTPVAAPKRLRVDRPEVTFNEPSAEKVVAVLKSDVSGRYTKLAQNVQRIATLEEEIKEKKSMVKADTRELIADLFSSDDCARTRVVDTLSFIMTLSKDPKVSETYKYEKVLEELTAHLTPELIKVLEAIKAKYKGETQKAASLKIAAKTAESVDLSEGPMDTMKSFYAKFKNAIFGWAAKYDQQLENLKRSIGEM